MRWRVACVMWAAVVTASACSEDDPRARDVASSPALAEAIAPQNAPSEPAAAVPPTAPTPEVEPEPSSRLQAADPCEVASSSDLPGVRIEILGPCVISRAPKRFKNAKELSSIEREMIFAGNIKELIRYRVVVDAGVPEVIPSLPTMYAYGDELPELVAVNRKLVTKKGRYFSCDPAGPSGLIVEATFDGQDAHAEVPRGSHHSALLHTGSPGETVACDFDEGLGGSPSARSTPTPLPPTRCEDRAPQAVVQGDFPARFVFNGRHKIKSGDTYEWSSEYLEDGAYPLVISARGVRVVDGEDVPFEVTASTQVHLIE